MLFRTFDPYYDDIMHDKIFELKECFICYDSILNNDTHTLQLNRQQFYLKKCQCNGSIHKICLDRWVDINKNCPICRTIIKKNDYVFIEIVDYNKKNSIIISKTFWITKTLLITIFFIMDYYILLLYIMKILSLY